MSRTKNASRNIIWGVLNKIVTLGMPFITRTVMIYTMGICRVGLPFYVDSSGFKFCRTWNRRSYSF